MTDIKTPNPGRGGARPGAGRPKSGVASVIKIEVEALSAASLADGVTPLEYALRVMRDPAASTARRDRMATVAMPYCHARASDAALGKKAMAQANADTAGHGTGWGTDLDTLN
jgi:hypothetical protein